MRGRRNNREERVGASMLKGGKQELRTAQIESLFTEMT